MALKPRTFRRIVLLSSLATIVLVIMLGYFVVRPMRSEHLLNSMRIKGMEASSAGDYAQATKLLGRYLRSADEHEPEIVLAFARARLKFQTSDGGHVRIAIKSYRSYLKDVPDDVEAAGELLPLFNMVGMNLEARDLALKLRTEQNDSSILVLREELIARMALKPDDEQIEPILYLILDHPDAQFSDLLNFTEWARKEGRFDEAQSYLAERVKSGDDGVELRLIGLWVGLSQAVVSEGSESTDLYSHQLAEVIGLDAETAQWITEPTFLDEGIVNFVGRVFNQLGHPELSLAVRQASAQILKDTPSMVWVARRLYWNHDLESLYALDSVNADGEESPDVLGYQAIAYLQNGADTDSDSLIKKLNEIDIDFRAKAWNKLIKGERLRRDGQLIEARQTLKNALDLYSTEPEFHIVMGDIHFEQGRLIDAKNEWLDAQNLVLNEVGNVGWIDPLVRVIRGYTSTGRLTEVTEYVDGLAQLAPRNPVSTVIWLQTYATMARTGGLGKSKISQVLTNYENARSEFAPNQKANIASQIATLYASIGRNDDARAIIQSAIAAQPSPQIVLNLIDVDQRFELDAIQDRELLSKNLAHLSPQRALQFAFLKFAQTQDIEQGLEIITKGEKTQADGDAYQWELVRAKYLDAGKDPRAMADWDRLRNKYPENIDLLYQIAESYAYGADLSKVEEVIESIVKKTSTLGKTQPSRLRLARVSALIRGTKTKDSRDEAIGIVRSVVASEPRNISARNILGNLLSMKPSPTLEPKDSFVPDFDGAIDQYMTISRQTNGLTAQKYLLEAIDLSTEAGKAEDAERYLVEYETKFSSDLQMLMPAAKRYESLNDLESAIAIYRTIIQNEEERVQTIDSRLALANIYITQRKNQEAESLLEALNSESTLEGVQLTQLASMYWKTGFPEQALEIALGGEHYGLSPIDAKLAYAQYAQEFLTRDEYTSALRAVVELDPENGSAWKQLILSSVYAKDFTQAKVLVSEAREHLPDDAELDPLDILAQGELTSASALLEAGAIQSSEENVEAIKRVDAYMAAKENGSNESLSGMLVSMLNDFAEFGPIQRFALSELTALDFSPKQLASLADRASRVVQGDTLIMRIASDAYLRDQNPTRALQVAQRWKVSTPGTTIEADLAIARALIQLQSYREAWTALAPYVDGATLNPTDTKNIDILYAYSYAQLHDGEDPDLLAQRLEPLLASYPLVRTRVWLSLVVGSIPTEDQAVDWLNILSGYASQDESKSIAVTWLTVVDRFDTKNPLYPTNAIHLLEPLRSAHPDDLDTLNSLALAYYLRAKSSEDDEARKADFQSAVSYMDQADEKEPSNPIFLAKAAGYSTEAHDFSAAEARYRALLERDLLNSRFSASIKNNLAMVIERRSSETDRLLEALDLVNQSISEQDAPSFWGTKGWVELALNRLDDAEGSFQHVIDLEPGNIEGWVGLAIVQHQLGEKRQSDATRSFSRVQRYIDDGLVSDELLERLKNQGADQWVSVIKP